MTTVPSSFQLIGRWLTFRMTKEEVLSLEPRLLILGLLGTWLAGIGRYWDDPNAELLQHLGLGSVIYVFVLAALLYPFIWIMKVESLSYFRLLTFISLTSFPALLYAIPVERFTSIESATTLNAWFLVIVAAWRLALLIRFTCVIGPMSIFESVITSLCPIMLVIAALTMLNLHRVVFDVMGGFRDANPHNGAYEVLFLLTLLSYLAFIPCLLVYAGIAFSRRRGNKTV